MSSAIIALNDSAIVCAHEGRQVSAPGYALLTEAGVVTGDDARRSAWLLPQQSHNQYWHQLGLSPLKRTNRHARHHADLAYAQLQDLYRQAGQPQSVIFAVPGNLSNKQLSILLGLAKASPFNAVGLVDSAVAAACHADISGDVVHLDIQLHATVITRIACGGKIQRQQVLQYPEVSLKGFQDTWAHYIADQFIRQYRYDPMHNAGGEQQLRDLLPGWLEQLRQSNEVEIEIMADPGNFRLNIQRADFIAANNERWHRLTEALAAVLATGRPDGILLSHHFATLPGIEDQFDFTGYCESDAVISTCQRHAPYIVGDTEKLLFITQLPLISATHPDPHQAKGEAGEWSGKTPKARMEKSTSMAARPTHLLYRDRAHSLARGLCIQRSDQGLELIPADMLRVNLAPDTRGRLTIHSDRGRIRIETDQARLPMQCTGNLDDLRRGDELSIDREILRLIEVL